MLSGALKAGSAIRRDTRIPTTRQAAAVSAVVFLAYVTFELRWPDHDAVQLLDTLIFPALGLIYVPLCAVVAMNARGRLRLAWWAITIGLASWALGEVILAYYELSLGEVPFPSWADAAYLAYVPWVAIGLLLFPSARNWRDQGRMVLDGLIVTGSFFLISWLGVLRAVWNSEVSSGRDFAISLAYPLGDVLVVTLGFLILLRAPSGLRTTFGLLVAGLACAAFADSVWVYLTNPRSIRPKRCRTACTSRTPCSSSWPWWRPTMPKPAALS